MKQSSSAQKILKKVNSWFRQKQAYVYIACDREKTRLITGWTVTLDEELEQWDSIEHNAIDFAGNKIHCPHLLYYKRYFDVEKAISKVSEMDKWTIEQKVEFIGRQNPGWAFLSKPF